jgi:hypothetical protein
MWGPAIEKGVALSYWLNAANSDPHILDMWSDVLNSPLSKRLDEAVYTVHTLWE